jgi:dissimilatory sulfite reductase (desulfoviridin) alpha/beta subunit
VNATAEDATMTTAVKDSVSLQVDLTDEQALALAQFIKRVGWREFRGNAVDDAEAYTIRTALDLVREELADHGYAPR